MKPVLLVFVVALVGCGKKEDAQIPKETVAVSVDIKAEPGPRHYRAVVYGSFFVEIDCAGITLESIEPYKRFADNGWKIVVISSLPALTTEVELVKHPHINSVNNFREGTWDE